MSTQSKDKEIIYKDRLIGCVDKCLEDRCNSNQEYINDYEVNASTLNDDWIARHLSHLDEDNEKNIDLISICFVDGEENEFSCSSDFSSYATSVCDNTLGNGFKVYDNALYDEDCDDN